MAAGKLGLRMFSIEKLRFLAGTCTGAEILAELAGLRLSKSAASSMSVGVCGGEDTDEKEEERRDLGEEGRGGEKRGELVLGGEGEGPTCIPGFPCNGWGWWRPPRRVWCCWALWARPPNIFLNPASLRLQPG